MQYLKLCETNDQNEFRNAFQQLGTALRNFALLSGRKELINNPPNVFYQGICRLYSEYDTLYWAIDDPAIENFLQQVGNFRGRFRRPETVRIVAQV